jgi:hypothetical protein
MKVTKEMIEAAKAAFGDGDWKAAIEAAFAEAVVIYNSDSKFDLQLKKSLIEERKLADIFTDAKIEKIEVKAETWQWRRTGNIAIEYSSSGRKSGIAVTEADMWVHQINDDDGTPLVYLMFPTGVLIEICRSQYRSGKRVMGGDGGGFGNVLLSLDDMAHWLMQGRKPRNNTDTQEGTENEQDNAIETGEDGEVV